MGAASQSVSVSWLASKTSLFRLGLPWDRDLPIHTGLRVPTHPTTFSSGGSDAGGEEYLDGPQRPKSEFQEGKFPARVRPGPVWYPYMQGARSSCSAPPPLYSPATLDANPEPGQGETVLRDSLSPVPLTPRS